ncbi:unknown [Prevotella sp. CAG:474]|nr:unknown [Prevotella sp. CAG:474]
MYTHAKEIGGGLRCLHCKYNNNVHTHKENRQESDGWGRKSYDAACSSPDVVKYMAIFVYAPCFAHFNPKQNPLF